MAVDGHAHWPPVGIAFGAQEAAEHVHRFARWLLAGEGHEHHLVAARRLAVPGAVLADEHAGAERGGQGIRAARPGQAERGRVRAECVVGDDGGGHQVGPLRRHPRVHSLAVIAVGPAVKAAVAHGAHVVGHQVAAEFVALVDGRPEGAAGGPGQTVGVAQAGGEKALLAALEVDLPDGRAAFFGRHAGVGDIAVGADGGVELAAVGAGNDVLGPVVVEWAAGQVGNPGAFGGDLRGAWFVGEAHHAVGVGDIEVVADQRHAEGRIEPLEQSAAHLRDTVAVGVAQQGNAVGAGHAGAGARHHLVHDPHAQAVAVGPAGRVGFGHEHVAVGQHVQPARVIELVGECHHLRARRGHRRCAAAPAAGRGDLDCGQQAGGGRRQLRLSAGAGRNSESGRVAARREHADRGEHGAERSAGTHGSNLHRYGSFKVGAGGRLRCHWQDMPTGAADRAYLPGCPNA